MAYKITDDCVNCGVCAHACPTNAPYQGDGKYEIEQGCCIECGICMAECPNDAIIEE